MDENVVRDLSDEDIEKGLTDLREERTRRDRLKYPVTHVCTYCYTMVSEAALVEGYACVTCGGGEFRRLQEAEG